MRSDGGRDFDHDVAFARRPRRQGCDGDAKAIIALGRREDHDDRSILAALVASDSRFARPQIGVRQDVSRPGLRP